MARPTACRRSTTSTRPSPTSAAKCACHQHGSRTTTSTAATTTPTNRPLHLGGTRVRARVVLSSRNRAPALSRGRRGGLEKAVVLLAAHTARLTSTVVRTRAPLHVLRGHAGTGTARCVTTSRRTTRRANAATTTRAKAGTSSPSRRSSTLTTPSIARQTSCVLRSTVHACGRALCPPYTPGAGRRLVLAPSSWLETAVASNNPSTPHPTQKKRTPQKKLTIVYFEYNADKATLQRGRGCVGKHGAAWLVMAGAVVFGRSFFTPFFSALSTKGILKGSMAEGSGSVAKLETRAQHFSRPRPRPPIPRVV